jgi:hypothetical protein
MFASTIAAPSFRPLLKAFVSNALFSADAPVALSHAQQRAAELELVNGLGRLEESMQPRLHVFGGEGVVVDRHLCLVIAVADPASSCSASQRPSQQELTVPAARSPARSLGAGALSL